MGPVAGGDDSVELERGAGTELSAQATSNIAARTDSGTETAIRNRFLTRHLLCLELTRFR
jgi:hypothetical protein